MRRIASYALAVILPLLSALANARFASLSEIPFALYLISITLVSALGGMGAGLFAAFCSIFIRIFFQSNALSRSAFIVDLGAEAVLVACAFFVGSLSRQRRRASEELESTLSALQERTDALSQSLHSGKCASWVLDASTSRVRYFSDSFPIFGRPFEEIGVFGTFHSYVHPEDLPRLRKLDRDVVSSSAPFVVEYRVLWPDGSTHWLESRGTRVPAQPHLWRGVTVDVTDRKLAEAALLRSEKLAAMGRLASTVAHEINNPLEAVTNLLYLSRADPSLSGETSAYLSTAEIELARLGDITRLTLGFVRSSESRRSILVAGLLDEVLTIFRHRYERRGIRVERNYEPEIYVLTTPHELRQIATNLIANAVDASIPPDYVSNAAPDAADPDEAAFEPKIALEVVRDGDCAVFSIADNGQGIPAEQQARIFEPFFTTKPEVGTGIGLWVTRELVEKNGGVIAVESTTEGSLKDGMKTRFCLRFPLAAPETAAPEQGVARLH